MIPGRRARLIAEPRRQETTTMPRITPNLWFDGNGEEAAEFYVSVFPSSEITTITRYGEVGPGEPGAVMTIGFVLDGEPFTIINGGPQFTFDEAVSFEIRCADQAEVDYYWETLTDGGEESQCGWLKDRFGLSWQVVPEGWEALLTGSDPARIERAMTAMFGMQKLDIAALEAAADDVSAGGTPPASGVV
jgi:predicted 3-demethylubiquinone-9 3-methyltransferase (glyoxalase superfamily)